MPPFAYDLSPFNAQKMQLAQTNPALDAVKSLPAGAAQIGKQFDDKMLDDFLQSGADSIAEAAKKLGLNPDQYRSLALADKDKALDMLAKHAEKMSASNAEQYVGEELGSIAAPEDEFDENGLLTEASKGKYKQHQEMIQRRVEEGVAGSQSEFVRKAWQSRKEKLEAEKTLKVQERTQKFSDTSKMANDIRSIKKDILQSAGLTNYIEKSSRSGAGNQAVSEAMADLQRLSKKGSDATVYFNTPSDATVNELSGGWSKIARFLLYRLNHGEAPTNPQEKSWWDKMVGSVKGAVSPIVSSTGFDTPGDDELAKAQIEKAMAALGKDQRAAQWANEKMRQALMDGVFAYITEKTGAASSDAEQAKYLANFSYGKGAASMIKQFQNIQKNYNKQLAEAKKQMKVQLGNQVKGVYGATDAWHTMEGMYESQLQSVDNMADIPTIPDALIESLANIELNSPYVSKGDLGNGGATPVPAPLQPKKGTTPVPAPLQPKKGTTPNRISPTKKY